MIAPTPIPPDRSTWPAISELQETGRLFYQRGWSIGTSSNYSLVVGRRPLRLLITTSGKDKGRLAAEDFVVVEADGRPVPGESGRPSAETLLHCVLAEQPHVGCVLHTHSVWATVLSDLYHHDGALEIEGYEMLKGLAGVTTHEQRRRVEIFENTQDIPALAAEIRRRLEGQGEPLGHGFLLRRHGLYAWGGDLFEARRHVEIFEFLFEVIARRMSMAAVMPLPVA